MGAIGRSILEPGVQRVMVMGTEIHPTITKWLMPIEQEIGFQGLEVLRNGY